MKKIFPLLTFILAGLGVFAQDTKVIEDRNAQKRPVQAFHAIAISGGIDLYLSQSDAEAVAVSASDIGFRDRIITSVDKGVLHIYIDNKGFNWRNWGDKHLKAYVSCKTLDELKASGGSDVYIQDPLRSEGLNLNLSGGSDLRGKMNIGELAITMSGGSDAYISGSATQLSVHASGGSDFHGYDLPADNCRIESSGGSDAYITVNKELSANATGGSDIHYKGHGMVRESHTSGSGSITKKD
jgi:hypothetical protein